MELTVTDADTAQAVGSGDVPVLGTPRVLALAEAATVAATADPDAAGRTTVGVRVELAHRAPPRSGVPWSPHARLVEADGRRLLFEVTVTDGDTTVAPGRVERALVDRQRFVERAARCRHDAGSREIADRVHVLREPLLDVNVTLVVGDGAALLVDTLSTAGQAAALAAAARAVTPHPWTLVNTHHHFDHCFGNATLAADPPRPVYAHEVAAAALRDRPDQLRRAAYEEMRGEHPGLAAELAGRDPAGSDARPCTTETVLDVGGRRVVLRHPGHGHTDADLVVHVPDADVLVAGDLVEQSGPPAFEESYPLQWPDAVAELLRMTTPATVVVPGHGAPVDAAFVRAQHAAARRAGLADPGRATPAARRRSGWPPRPPFGARPGLIAARRGYPELDGTA